MYARCPHCSTVFAITAAQLRAALGHVQCGRCARVFDALPYLVDSPDEIPVPAAPADADTSLDWSFAEALEAEQEAEPAADRSAVEAGRVEGRREETVGEAPSPVGSPASADRSRGVPAALVEDLARPAPVSRWRGVAALGLALVLLLTVALQYAWFAPSDLVSRYPQAGSFVEALCAFTGCDVGDGRAPESIRVVSRTVRVHPRYEGALRVRAVIVNTAPRAQPYPRVRFTLFNVNGETIGSRVFAPHEYLGAAPASGEQLPSRTPLQIALELIAPEDVAVSYEFKFL